MKVSRWGGRLGMCCLLTLVFLWSCREEPPSNFDRNLAPETVITLAPAESTLSFYQVHLFWHGSDPDGVIDYFEYSITDSNKTPGEDDPGFSGYLKTTQSDSTFLLSADQPQILGHRFYIRAVDNEGKTDPTPAWTYFVAHNFNFPNVEFIHRSGSSPWKTEGTWTDRAGDIRTDELTSFSRAAPTDTIGVGGSVVVSWTGFDVDPGGTIKGYEWRTSDDPGFTFIEGSEEDTITVSVDFSQPPGTPITSWYSGNGAVFVRAIDDAGSRTNPDSIRSYVVNFGPITWIVDPDQVSPPVRNSLFTDTQNQAVWPSGTLLADTGQRFIQFKYTGFDDPRDMSVSCDDPPCSETETMNPSGITGFQWRRLKNGGGVAYQHIPDWKSFPEVSDFVASSPLTSGDYTFLIRAIDELGRAGRPETLRVGINYYPFFTSVEYEDPEDQLLKDLWMPASNGSQADTADIFFPQVVGGGYADLRVAFLSDDNHNPPPDKHPLDFNPVVEQELGRLSGYSIRLNNARGGFEDAPVDSLGQPATDERFFPVSNDGGNGVVASGLNTLDLRVRDVSGRIRQLTLVFRAFLE